jgi:hypothetical protein
MSVQVFYDGSVSGLDKVNLFSLIKSFSNDKVKFNEKQGIAVNARLANKRTLEGSIQVFRLVGRLCGLYSDDPIEATFVNFNF